MSRIFWRPRSMAQFSAVAPTLIGSVCVCVCEREREKERKRGRKKEEN